MAVGVPGLPEMSTNRRSEVAEVADHLDLMVRPCLSIAAMVEVVVAVQQVADPQAGNISFEQAARVQQHRQCPCKLPRRSPQVADLHACL